jgi:hypothetical protein
LGLPWLRRFVAGAAVVLGLLSCGGGGDKPDTKPVVIPPRSDVLFGYYGTAPGQIDATHEHVSLVWSGPWRGLDGQIQDLQEAQGRKLPVVVDISYLLFANRRFVGPIAATAALRQYFAGLSALGLLDSIAALYPLDEPDLNLDDPTEILPAADVVRSVAAEFNKRLPLWAIYSHAHPVPPAADTFDALGVDWYGHGPQDFPRKPGQRLIIVAGGADPFREQPRSYEDFAAVNGDVVALVAFVDFDYELGLGIGHNGMAPDYRAAGCRLTRKC